MPVNCFILFLYFISFKNFNHLSIYVSIYLGACVMPPWVSVQHVWQWSQEPEGGAISPGTGAIDGFGLPVSPKNHT